MLLSTVKKLIYFSPFLFPAYLVRFQVAGIPFTALEIFTYLLFILWYIERIRDRHAFAWDKDTRRYFYTAALFLVGASLGAVFIPQFVELPDRTLLDTQHIAWGIWKGWIVAPLLYFIVVSQALKTSAQIKTVLRHFIYSAAALSLISYIYSLFGSGLSYDFRLRGIFESANYLALYIAPALLLNIYFISVRDPWAKAQNHIDVATVTILAHALLFTQSYAAVLGVFGALFLSIFSPLGRGSALSVAEGQGGKKFLAVITALAGILLIVFTAQYRTLKFKNFLNFEERSSTSVRIEIYQVSAKLVQEHPILGIGLGQFQNQYQIKAPSVLGHEPLEWNMPQPHNIFLAFWLNAGLLGLIALLIFIVLIHRSFTYPLIAMWGLLLHGLFDTPFWKNDLAMIFWLLLAAILILQSSRE